MSPFRHLTSYRCSHRISPNLHHTSVRSNNVRQGQLRWKHRWKQFRYCSVQRSSTRNRPLLAVDNSRLYANSAPLPCHRSQSTDWEREAPSFSERSLRYYPPYSLSRCLLFAGLTPAIACNPAAAFWGRSLRSIPLFVCTRDCTFRVI